MADSDKRSSLPGFGDNNFISFFTDPHLNGGGRPGANLIQLFLVVTDAPCK